MALSTTLAAHWGCSGTESEPKTTRVDPPANAAAEGTLSRHEDGEQASSVLSFRVQELPFLYERGETGAAWPVETTGGGVGLLDYDGDGDIDLFFAQGVPLPVGKARPGTSDVLLENQGEGRFTDVSAKVGLSVKGYGQGVTVADYDGDRDPDVYVTRYGTNTLWRNDHGKFTDVTTEAGVGCGLWSLGAAFADFDGDGDLDLFVANYLEFNPADAPYAHDPKTGLANYGMPNDFKGQPDVLYWNEGNGHFREDTKPSVVAASGRGMGVITSDLDGDGRIDIFVANDAQANALWKNRGDGRFEEIADAIGLAFNGEGQAEANMGIALGDTNNDGLQDLMITHFFGEHLTLWRAGRFYGGGLNYQDNTNVAGLASDSRPLTGWGTAMADFDLDGDLDMIVTNGHIRREPGQRFLYENPPLLWRNNGKGRFENVTAKAGPYFQSLHMGRGLAAGDLDGDGDLDVVIVHHHAPSVILWNESPRLGNYLIVDLKGRGKNSDAIGAKLTAEIGDRRLVREINGGGSYISSHDRRVHFGIGKAERVDRLQVVWPSGKVESRTDLSAGTVMSWEEPDTSKPSAATR